jgi:hypothetical protein
MISWHRGCAQQVWAGVLPAPPEVRASALRPHLAVPLSGLLVQPPPLYAATQHVPSLQSSSCRR